MSGMVRIRAIPPDGMPYAVGLDTVIEVQDANGEWVRLSGVYAVDISTIVPDQPIVARLGVYVAELDLTAEEVEQRSEELP